MGKHRYFVTGTDTGVGKTFVSTILCRKLGAVYYKPIQSGALFARDADFVSQFGCKVEDSTYNLPAPESPNIAGRMVGVRCEIENIAVPDYDKLIVEGAGGVMVPINESQTMLDLILHFDLPVIVVSSTKLGTINHSLMTLKVLRAAGAKIAGVISNGAPHGESLDSILSFGKCNLICQIPHGFTINDENIAGLDLNL